MAFAVTHLIGFAAGVSGGCECAPAYVTGDRTAAIAVTATAGLFDGSSDVTKLVDGDTASNAYTHSCVFATGGSDTGSHIRFQFAAPTRITEARLYQSAASTHGTWKWQGSYDAASWTDIGPAFTLGGTTVQAMTSLSGNTAGYLIYQLICTSGTASDSPWIREFEFQQCAC